MGSFISGPPAAFTRSELSGNIAVVAAGTFTFNHTLGVEPKLVELFLKLTAAASGYSAGAIIPIKHQSCAFDGGGATYNGGTALEITAAAISGRFGNGASAFYLMNFGTGSFTGGGIVNTNANLIIRVSA